MADREYKHPRSSIAQGEGFRMQVVSQQRDDPLWAEPGVTLQKETGASLWRSEARASYVFSDLTYEKIPFSGKDCHFALSPTPLPAGEGRRGEGETMNGFETVMIQR